MYSVVSPHLCTNMGMFTPVIVCTCTVCQISVICYYIRGHMYCHDELQFQVIMICIFNSLCRLETLLCKLMYMYLTSPHPYDSVYQFLSFHNILALLKKSFQLFILIQLNIYIKIYFISSGCIFFMSSIISTFRQISLSFHLRSSAS